MLRYSRRDDKDCRPMTRYIGCEEMMDGTQLTLLDVDRAAGGPPLELSRLEAHLWESANILRGPVDAADFKPYIFPLLVLKRISDVYDEEMAAALAESEGDQEYALQPE